MKKITALFCAALLCFSAVNAVFAYDTPFDVPEPTEPGGAGEACEVEYSLRGGGTFIYNNNPEALTMFNVGQALMIESDINGDVYFTSENQNKTGRSIYLGLQVRNGSGEDITVTVRNIGYQVGGDWQGQHEWADFFDTRYEIELPKNSSYGADSPIDPAGFETASYVIPDGKYFYVIGGTTADAYENINVADTANKRITKGQCVNAAVYFTVEGPATGVSAAYVCYDPSYNGYVTSASQQGYVVEKEGGSYGRQYLGSAPALCAEASLAWTIDDTVRDGTRLPVRYSVTYYEDHQSYGAYGAYTGAKTNVVSGDAWYTHLNSANHNEYVGTDMMPFYCVTETGESVVIDVHHNDGTSKPANIGNWMVIYEESFTVRNSGEDLRTVAIYMENNGALAVNVREAEGDLIRSIYHHDRNKPVYTAEVAGSRDVTFVLEYVLAANSYGNVKHYAVTGTVEQVKWDFDRSGSLDADDAIRLLRCTLFPDKFPLYQKGDLDGDGTTSSDDAIFLLRYLLFGR